MKAVIISRYSVRDTQAKATAGKASLSARQKSVAAYHAIGHHIPHLGWLQVCDHYHSSTLHLIYWNKIH